MGEIQSNEINSVQAFFDKAIEDDLSITISYMIYNVYSAYTTSNTQKYYLDEYDKSFVSMDYSENGQYVGYLPFSQDNFGIITYIDDAQEIVDMFKFTLK